MPCHKKKKQTKKNLKASRNSLHVTVNSEHSFLTRGLAGSGWPPSFGSHTAVSLVCSFFVRLKDSPLSGILMAKDNCSRGGKGEAQRLRSWLLPLPPVFCLQQVTWLNLISTEWGNSIPLQVGRARQVNVCWANNMSTKWPHFTPPPKDRRYTEQSIP